MRTGSGTGTAGARASARMSRRDESMPRERSGIAAPCAGYARAARMEPGEHGRTDRYGSVGDRRGGTAPHATVPSRSPFDPREIWRRLRWYTHAGVPLPPEAVPWARFHYGLAQPLLGMRVILRDRRMLGEALAPVLFVFVVCLFIAAGLAEELQEDDKLSFIGITMPWWLAVVVMFFVTFASVAPVPPMLF